MNELRRETFPEGKFTLVFMGYGDATEHAVIELTWNWGDEIYSHGSGYGHVALEVSDIRAFEARAKNQGVEILRPAGPMKFAPEETGHRENICFIADPDGYRIELIEAE